jgi:hypothetical protein
VAFPGQGRWRRRRARHHLRVTTSISPLDPPNIPSTIIQPKGSTPCFVHCIWDRTPPIIQTMPDVTATTSPTSTPRRSSRRPPSSRTPSLSSLQVLAPGQRSVAPTGAGRPRRGARAGISTQLLPGFRPVHRSIVT